MAFPHTLKTAFFSITVTCFLLFVLQGDPSPSSVSHHIEPPVEFSVRLHMSAECSILGLTQKIFDAIDYRNRTRLFVADPLILRTVSSIPSSIRPTNQSQVCDKECDEEIQVLNLGLLASHFGREDVLDQICEPLKSQNMTCLRIESEWVWPLNQTLVTHVVVASSHVKVHIAYFIPVLNNVLWVQAMQRPDPGFLFGVNQSEVYDSIETRDIPGCKEVMLPVPMDTKSFMRQIPMSRFVSCDQESARNLTAEKTEGPAPVQINTQRSIVQMKSLMDQMQVPFFLISGSLLGWYRECRAIPYTTDADFATFATYATPDLEQKVLQLSHRHSSFRVYNIFGKFDMGYEISFVLRNGFKSDLFFLYEESDKRLSTSGHVVSQRMYYKYFYPAIQLCSTIFLGIRVNVPCNTEAILTAEYGDWRTRVEDSVYSYRTSPRNRGPAIRYPGRMFPLYREFP